MSLEDVELAEPLVDALERDHGRGVAEDRALALAAIVAGLPRRA